MEIVGAFGAFIPMQQLTETSRSATTGQSYLVGDLDRRYNEGGQKHGNR